jgi:DNA-binding NarL/FixJ family response regulator
VHAGKKTLSPEVSFQLAEHLSQDSLTPAEVRVLRLIAEGNANKEIAAQLTLSVETVNGQVRSVLSKLGAKDRTHAAMIALKRGIIEF